MEERGFMPEPQPGDLEAMCWSLVPEELRGQETTLDKLKERFPPKGGFSEIREIQQNRRFVIYGIVSKGGHLKIAYYCGVCKRYFFGPPRINNEDDLNDAPL